MQLEYRDDAFKESLNKVLSGFLPHKNFVESSFVTLYSMLTDRISEKEMRGIYYPFRYILHRYYLLAVDSGITPRISEEKFKGALENIVFDMVSDRRTEMSLILAEEGLTFDLTIPTYREQAAQTLYRKVFDLYQECLALEINTNDALGMFVELDEAIKRNYIDLAVANQQEILTNGLQIGRFYYQGGDGWMSYISAASKELADFCSHSGKCLECDSYTSLIDIESSMESSTEPLCDYGIPNLDDETPMLQNRLAVIIGKENIGKTKVMTSLVAKLIINGIKPYVATGETTTSLYFFQVLSSYIYQKYELHIPPSMLTSKNIATLDIEDQQIVNTAKYSIMNSGLVIDDSLSYDTVLSTFVKYYNKGCRAFFIDHSQSLRGRKGRAIGELVTTLALDCREFKNSYPVYVCVLSHPSSEFKDILQKDPNKAKTLQISPTAQSSTLSTEADEIFILFETQQLIKENLLGWITYKRRGPKIDTIYIRKQFHVSSFTYDDKDQAGADTIEMEDLDAALNLYDEELEDGLDIDID